MTIKNMSDEDSDAYDTGQGILSAIEDFVETTLVLKKDRELGISIIGGSDTYLHAVCVDEIHDDGAAYHDGRLRRGDQILAVNGVSLQQLTHAQALGTLREASSPLRLSILRENPEAIFTTTETPKKFATVEIAKPNPFCKFGISILGRKDGIGVFITWVQPDSPAARSNKIRQGDRILEVNGQDVRRWSQKKVANLLWTTVGPMVLLLGRFPELSASIQAYTKSKMFPSRERSGTWCGTKLGSPTYQNMTRPKPPVRIEMVTSDTDNSSDCLRVMAPENVRLLNTHISPSFQRARSNTEVVWGQRMRNCPALPLYSLAKTSTTTKPASNHADVAAL
ncbi:PREDICTED: multiple PDZ domain protein-like isoform X2 [Priapulus caudatus]|nr:PREDICTED: multiple PDZ domain protein-like isoform X2 [Priapulus caudatus]